MPPRQPPQAVSNHPEMAQATAPASHRVAPPAPPIWQGRARHGEDAAVLGRNPDGTFQVRLNGAEKTFKESQVAAMTGMQRGPLYEMLGRATVGRMNFQPRKGRKTRKVGMRGRCLRW
ncbi:hypothetical protein [Prosthecobacter algae]|uniref:hypothetical protein n=1 Tax=Prosthecobacter algae TaxID=1144682 RepID=UPI0031EE1DC7